MIRDDDDEDQYRIRDPEEVDISASFGHFDPRAPLAAFLLILLLGGTILALVIEATKPGGH